MSGGTMHGGGQPVFQRHTYSVPIQVTGIFVQQLDWRILKSSVQEFSSPYVPFWKKRVLEKFASAFGGAALSVLGLLADPIFSERAFATREWVILGIVFVLVSFAILLFLWAAQRERDHEKTPVDFSKSLLKKIDEIEERAMFRDGSLSAHLPTDRPE